MLKLYLNSNYRAVGGFTFIEIMIVVAIIGVLTGLAMPSLNDLQARSLGMKCSENLRLIQTAKCEYASEHPGEGSPATSDQKNTFRAYFPQGFVGVCDTCPANGGAYTDAAVYDLYQNASCVNNAPYGTDDGQVGVGLFPYEIKANAPNYQNNGYHDLGRTQ